MLCKLDAAGFEALTAAPLPALRALTLRACERAGHPAGLRRLAGAPWMSNLRRLRLCGCRFVNPGLGALVAARLPALQELALIGTCQDVLEDLISSSRQLPALTSLDLSSNGTWLDAAAAGRLGGAGFASRLQSLSLAFCPLGGGAAALAAAPLAALRDLDLTASGADDGVVGAIARASWASQLTALRLADNDELGAGGGGAWGALRGAPLLQLRVLDLSSCYGLAACPKALAALEGADWITNLQVLRLPWRSGDEGGGLREALPRVAALAAGGGGGGSEEGWSVPGVYG